MVYMEVFMDAIFDDLLEEFAPFGRECLEVAGLSEEDLHYLLTERAIITLRETKRDMNALEFFIEIATCAEQIKRCPGPLKSSEH